MEKTILMLTLFAIVCMVFLSGCIGQGPVSTTTTTVPAGGTTTEVPSGPGGKVPAKIGTAVSGTKLSARADIAIQNFAFDPSDVHITVGGTVTWSNLDSVTHSIVSDQGSEISSGDMANGQTFSHTFPVAGTYTYHCSIHPSMVGTIVVG